MGRQVQVIGQTARHQPQFIVRQGLDQAALAVDEHGVIRLQHDLLRALRKGDGLVDLFVQRFGR